MLYDTLQSINYTFVMDKRLAWHTHCRGWCSVRKQAWRANHSKNVRRQDVTEYSQLLAGFY